MNADNIQRILDVIMRLAAGDLSARGQLGGTGDEIDALIAGVNMLAEELEDRSAKGEILLAETQQNLEVISAQHETIMALSTPALLIWDGVLVLPIIGLLDTRRTSILTEKLLRQVVEQQARTVIIDVTGLTEIDDAVADHLIRTFNAIKLLGAKCILTGVQPQQARSIVALGVTLEDVTTVSSLHVGLQIAIAAGEARRIGQ